VVSIAKRHVGPSDNFFELVSDGNMSLIRAVEKFDFARGNKFSTYASWAIMKNFARTIPDEIRYKDRYRTANFEMFSATEDQRSDQYEQESAQSQRQFQVGRILERLDEREAKIIISRFGLDHKQEPLTLKEVGAEMGVTKERVRQIEARALSKLRQAAEEDHIEAPGVG
jgi:RNA polymerase primary sigma factor/RNA polymerase sigma factor